MPSRNAGASPSAARSIVLPLNFSPFTLTAFSPSFRVRLARRSRQPGKLQQLRDANPRTVRRGQPLGAQRNLNHRQILGYAALLKLLRPALRRRIRLRRRVKVAQ